MQEKVRSGVKAGLLDEVCRGGAFSALRATTAARAFGPGMTRERDRGYE